jgi:hypothetical protein
LGSLTININRITHKNPSGGVIRKAHFQLLNALATFEPTMYLIISFSIILFMYIVQKFYFNLTLNHYPLVPPNRTKLKL